MKKLASLWSEYLDIRNFSKQHKRHFVINTLLGIFFLMLFLAVEDTKWGQGVINNWFDAYIRLASIAHQNAQSAVAAKDKVAFIDIDNPTFKAWGRPSLTPRDKLAQLLEQAYQSGAKVILLDIFFEEPDYHPAYSIAAGEEQLDGIARDNRLRQVLKDIKTGMADTKVILITRTDADMVLYPNIYQDLVDDKKIFLSVPYFQEGSDHMVRFWQPYYLVKSSEDATPAVLWTSPVLALALAGGAEKKLVEEQETILHQLGQKPSKKTSEIAVVLADKKYDFEFHYGGNNEHQYNRIHFYLIPPGVRSKNDSGGLTPNQVYQTSSGEMPDIVKNKIVIIGRSGADSQDIKQTSLGRMPGMYVHGNIIATLLQRQKPHLISLPGHIAIESVLILLASYIFMHCRPFVARLYFIGMFFLLWPLSYIWFAYTGIFINLSFAFTSIGLHEFIAQVEGLVAQKHHKTGGGIL